MAAVCGGFPDRDHRLQGHSDAHARGQTGRKVVGIEVKTGWTKKRSGLAAFRRKFRTAGTLLIGESGIPWEDFLSMDPIAVSFRPAAIDGSVSQNAGICPG